MFLYKKAIVRRIGSVCCLMCVLAFAEGIPPEMSTDWRAQDGTDAGATYPDVVRDIVDRLGSAGDELRGASAALAETDSERWAELYVRACALRRAERLKSLVAAYPRMVFTKHYDLGGSHYAYTEGQSDAQAERHFVPGSSLCLLTMEASVGTESFRTNAVETLLDDPTGVIRDPDVSYDGKRILFAWKKSLDEDDYHLYEMTVADRAVRQLTFGLGFADYEGAYLPNGDIVFDSTRCVQTVDCWWTEVSNLYTCDGDGRFLRRLSFDQVHTNFPTVTPDGRVIYTRWDYSDRGQIFPQGLFQMHADGTGQTECYGNNSWFPTTILHARGIPGTNKIVAVFSGHHCIQKGWLGILDPALGRQESQGAQLIAPVRPTEAAHIDQYGQDGDQFQYPYPLSESEFIVTFKPSESSAPFAIYWMDRDGRRELLVSDPAISCNQPVPLAPRPVPHVWPDTVDYREDSGTFYVQDVYRGPGLAGVPRGTIKNLRVAALDYRAAGIDYNTNKGPAGAALISTPVSIEGTWDVKIVLGTATVYDDGSACFTVPARTPVYFQALDAENQAVQTMRSWAQLQPGERFSCVGCHESKNGAPPPGVRTRALETGPQPLTPWYGPPRGFSFEKEIQPILDRHCVKCHYVHDETRMVDPKGALPRDDEKVCRAPAPDPTPPEGVPPPGVQPAFSLKGLPGNWSPAYRSLANRRVTNWIDIQESPAMLEPYYAGAAKSPLVAMLRKGHNEVALSREEMDRIVCWIDLLVPCCGDYRERLAGPGLERYNHFLAKREAWQQQESANIRALVEERAPATACYAETK